MIEFSDVMRLRHFILFLTFFQACVLNFSFLFLKLVFQKTGAVELLINFLDVSSVLKLDKHCSRSCFSCCSFLNRLKSVIVGYPIDEKRLQIN